MSENNNNSVHEVSQDPDNSLNEVVRELIDVGQFSFGSNGTQESGRNLEVNFDNVATEATTVAVEEEKAEDVPVTKVKKTRNKFSFAKKEFIAYKDFFLKAECQDKLPETDRRFLVGMIQKCPRKDTGNKFIIQWQDSKPEDIEDNWLATEFCNNDDVREALKDAIALEQVLKPQVLFSKMKKVAREVVIAAPTDADAADPETPPQVIAARASASIRTLPSISTMSRSVAFSSPEDETPEIPAARRSTRASVLDDDRWVAADDISDGEDFDEDDDAALVFADQSELPDKVEDAEEEDTRLLNSGVGRLVQSLKWEITMVENDKRGEVKDESNNTNYIGPMPGLKPHIARQFKDPLDALKIAGGLDDEFVAKLAQTSNNYFHTEIAPTLDKNKRYQGYPWKDISTSEMFQFLGLTLKISLSPVDGGGYAAYFHPKEKSINGLPIKGSSGFAHHYMQLWRYKQIRGALHPVDRIAGDAGDKAYHLRRAINQFNAAAKKSFNMGQYLVFDEGGVKCRSRYCPVRQYNPAKPDKFRVEFFILACSTLYIIHHLDVYQGKNAMNINIDPSIRDFPTTQKCVMNALIQRGLLEEGFCGRHIALDNRYACPELMYVLREWFNVNASGTCRTRRKGWNKELMTMKKTEARGAYRFAYDKNNRILLFQWNDNRVVNGCSSLLNANVVSVKRRVGATVQEFDCPEVLTLYQQTMFGVDKADQMRMHFGGFSAKSHYKKWYKRSFLAILDCMLLNGYLAWNLACKMEFGTKQELKRHEFYTHIAERLMNYDRESRYESPTKVQQFTSRVDRFPTRVATKHLGFPCSARQSCTVCRMENRWGDYNQDKLRHGIVECKECGVVAHSHIPLPDYQRKIHQLDCFRNLTCFEIMHTLEGCKIWDRDHKPKNKNYTVRMDHPIYKTLRAMYPKKPRRKRQKTVIEESDSSDGEYSNVERTEV